MNLSEWANLQGIHPQTAYVSRVSVWATAQGHSIDRVATEVGSGLNCKRRKFAATALAVFQESDDAA